MKFRVVESFDDTIDFLRSSELHFDLIDKFGDKYYEEPICKEVCEYVKEKSNGKLNDNNILSRFSVWVKTQEEIQPISNNGHFVILYGDRIYDYTSDQYVDYGVSAARGLRILKNTSMRDLRGLNDDFNGMLSGEETFYVSGNYLIIVP